MSVKKPMLDDLRDGPWFDEETFSTLRDTVSAEVFERLLHLFLENTSSKLREVKAVDPATEAERLAIALHALKGSALMVGAREVEAVAEDLRAAARGGRTTEAEEGIERLEEALDRVHQRVRKELEKA